MITSWALAVLAAHCGTVLGEGTDEPTDAGNATDSTLSGDRDGGSNGDGGGAPDPDAGQLPRCSSSDTFKGAVEVSELNGATSLGNGAARLTADSRTVYFFRVVGADDYRIFSATRETPTGVFNTPAEVELGRPLAELDSHPVTSADGAYLFFQRSVGGAALDAGRDIVWTKKTGAGGGFLPVSPVLGLNVPERLERTPYLASDDALWVTIHVTTDAGGLATRIARSEKIGEGQYNATPDFINLATPDGSDDGDPVVSVDGLNLYFSSTRGTTNYNIWMASRNDVKEPFGTPQSLTSLNTPTIETPSWISPDGCELYLQRVVGTNFHIFRASRR